MTTPTPERQNTTGNGIEVPAPDIQALIEEAHRMAAYVADGGPDDGTVYTRLAAALSALSSHAETETEWEYASRNRRYPEVSAPDSPDGWSFAKAYPEDYWHIRRRKAGEWEVVE